MSLVWKIILYYGFNQKLRNGFKFHIFNSIICIYKVKKQEELRENYFFVTCEPKVHHYDHMRIQHVGYWIRFKRSVRKVKLVKSKRKCIATILFAKRVLQSFILEKIPYVTHSDSFQLYTGVLKRGKKSLITTAIVFLCLGRSCVIGNISHSQRKLLLHDKSMSPSFLNFEYFIIFFALLIYGFWRT